MGLMIGTGALGRMAAGVWGSGGTLYLEPCSKRVRVVVGGETIADSRRVMMLQESGHQPIYYFPPEDVRSDVLSPSDRHTRCPRKGQASYWDIHVGDRVVEAGGWYYPTVIDGAPPALAGMIAFYWNRMDQWIEEDEEVFAHPRDPYHRVDIVQSNRHVKVSLDGIVLADSVRPVALFETGLPARWYLPREDVLVDLEDSDTTSRCPYKGIASYHSVPGGKDIVWCYRDPIPEASRIRGLVCFFNERVDLELDGELQERPESPWSHGVKGSSEDGRPQQRSAAHT
jgi:uncharacterized protein (DUF427 family)